MVGSAVGHGFSQCLCQQWLKPFPIASFVHYFGHQRCSLDTGFFRFPLFFTADAGSTSTGREVWRYDPATNVASVLLDIRAASFGAT